MTTQAKTALGILVLTGVFGLQVASGAARVTDLQSGPGFAVVELFTSQGCSSCPPADRVLARLADVAETENLPVYALSMHVDYWNRLGWRDPFSHRRYSARQQAYAQALGNGAFTPQVVVNGVDETVGSREADLTALIRTHVATAPEVAVSLDVEREGRDLQVVPEVDGEAAPPTVWIALSRRRSGNHVPTGENAGRELLHAHVVVALESVSAGQALSFELPEDLANAPITVTAFVQDRSSMRITAAARTAVAPENR